jgi:hypothetical protein
MGREEQEKEGWRKTLLLYTEEVIHEFAYPSHQLGSHCWCSLVALCENDYEDGNEGNKQRLQEYSDSVRVA